MYDIRKRGSSGISIGFNQQQNYQRPKKQYDVFGIRENRIVERSPSRKEAVLTARAMDAGSRNSKKLPKYLKNYKVVERRQSNNAWLFG
jgi:hypothetical protein